MSLPSPATLRGYRGEQLAARALLRTRRRLPLPLRLPPDAPPLDPAAVARLGAAALRELDDPQARERLRAGELRVAGAVLPLADAWAGAATSQLAAFTLHYHAWLVPLVAGDENDRRTAFDLLDRWLDEHPPARAALAGPWHPYVASSRVRAWTAILGAGPPAALRERLRVALWQSLALVAHWPERDVAGNHLLRNHAATVAGAALFAGPGAAALSARAAGLLAADAADQLRADGGHVERSVAYHAQVAGDLLDALDAQPAEAAGALGEAVAAALGWLAHVAPPGRPRPELNDGSPEIGAPTTVLLQRAGALGIRPRLASARPGEPRYVVLGADDTRLVIDCDQPCRPDLPYHAHADSLAIHLTVDGVPVVVDRGVATYEPGPQRAWWRSTAAHSTLLPAGGDTSEVLGAFRAGRLARTRIEAEDAHGVLAAHDGAGRPGRAHVRRVRQDGPRAWTLWDLAAVPEGAVVRFHLPPGASVEARDAGARIEAGGCRVSLAWDRARSVRVVSTEHAVGFGRVVMAPTIDVGPGGAVLRTSIRAAG